MARKHSSLSFEEFAAAINAAAGVDQMAGPLRLAAAGPVEDVRALASRAITEAFSIFKSGELEDGKILSLRPILEARLAPLLRKPKDEAMVSMLDVITPGVTTSQEVDIYLKRHGIDLDNHNDRQYAERIFEEAIMFFEDSINGGKRVHKEVRKTDREGLHDIFLTAAGLKRKINVPVACAILRIALVIDYMERDPSIALLPEAEAKLAEIMSHHFNRDKSRAWWFKAGGASLPMRLYNFEQRTKERKRMIAKLLHKPSNRTHEVLDHIGYRITTQHPVETLRLIHMMFFDPTHRFLPSAHIVPGESKNLLFDADKLREALGNPDLARELVQSLADPTRNHAELVTTHTGNGGDPNPHSASTYKSINIVFNFSFTKQDGTPAYLPIEIQFLDRETSFENTRGDAAHASYVERQMATIKRRILKNNLLTEYNERVG